MMTTDSTEMDLIPQRHKYIMQAPVWYTLIYSILKNGGKPENVMKQEVRPWESEVKNKV